MVKSRLEIQLISYIMTFWFILHGQVNSLDCRRHVFAPGCRGIVAKRTQANSIKFESPTLSSKRLEETTSDDDDLLYTTGATDDSLTDDSLQLKRFPLPFVFMVNRKPINSDYNPSAWLFSLTGAKSHNSNSPLTPTINTNQNPSSNADNTVNNNNFE